MHGPAERTRSRFEERREEGVAFLRSPPCDHEALVPRGRSREQHNVSGWHAESLGEHLGDPFIGAPSLGGRGDGHLQSVAVQSHDPLTAGAGLGPDAQQCSRFVDSDLWLRIVHPGAPGPVAQAS
jgi:hypothetical protein